ncbi:tannase/feruloyl esterase family alpha/beta hydrolase [Pseudoduganella namucuonensis]|uniref:Feruloyl esterase n=1 Tax=Pseudoduganella namucuonensis TaxID=1035707 RepID=A0A1I7KT48_9BURK|nr:tannase/feruloyl esterase family alpha/beta hydrolase [Pseudoduganella namucuonensis]SFV00516.1 feruloyl esterase [Pseudoduganella namucuonensis]
MTTKLKLLPLAGLLLAGSALADQCASLSTLKLDGVEIIQARAIADGVFEEDNATGRAGRVFRGLPGFCRVRGVARPVPGSQIEFDIWLPLKGWTRRLHMIGNGAYSSNIGYLQMINRLRAGDVAVATDTGHKGSELTFAIGKPESIFDFSHRAVHTTVNVAKAVTKAYYAAAPAYSYFSGCSTGGYQGLMEAQRYPEDFDGIIAGAPGNNRTALTLAFLWNYHVNHRPGEVTPILPQTKLPMITAAAVQACDALDGVKDGVINDPQACRFDPAALLCKAGDEAGCLTGEQVEVVRKLYAGPVDARNGKRIYPGYPVGSEGITVGEDDAHPGWSNYWANHKKPGEPLRLDFFRHWVYNDANWDWRAFNWGSDVDAVLARIGATFDANNPDLRRFRARKGKLLMFMGWQDPVGAAGEAINYYNAVEATSPKTSEQARREDTQDFLRLYMVPGMAHCAGGPGATHFNSATRDSMPPVNDAKHDMAIALQDWVERGVAPQALIATRFEPGAKADRKIIFQRPLCVYPQVARYTGGPSESAASFSCVNPN